MEEEREEREEREEKGKEGRRDGGKVLSLLSQRLLCTDEVMSVTAPGS